MLHNNSRQKRKINTHTRFVLRLNQLIEHPLSGEGQKCAVQSLISSIFTAAPGVGGCSWLRTSLLLLLGCTHDWCNPAIWWHPPPAGLFERGSDYPQSETETLADGKERWRRLQKWSKNPILRRIKASKHFWSLHECRVSGRTRLLWNVYWISDAVNMSFVLLAALSGHLLRQL